MKEREEFTLENSGLSPEQIAQYLEMRRARRGYYWAFTLRMVAIVAAACVVEWSLYRACLAFRWAERACELVGLALFWAAGVVLVVGAAVGIARAFVKGGKEKGAGVAG